MDTFKAVLSFIYFGYSEGIHFLILNHFSRLLFHVTGTLPWVLKSTSPKIFPNYFIVAYFYPIFPLVSTISEANNSTLAFTFQYLVTYGRPCHASDHQMLPNLLSRETEVILRGDKYLKYMPPLTYIIYLQPI